VIEYRSIADLNKTILDNLSKVPRDIDLVVGIPRSGLLAASMLALHLNLPLTDLDGFVEGRVISGGRRSRGHRVDLRATSNLRVFVLDDSIQSGEQMAEVKARIDRANLPHEIIFGVVYGSPQGCESVDICFEVLATRRLFEWNLMHHSILDRSCVDIDGVLCSDPTREQNDDGPAYADFLVNADPLLIPSVPIGWLVSCRLEKYRELTRRWLVKHGVTYRELIMMDLPSKEARVTAGSHGKFKADVYAKTGAHLFIESSDRQAREIAALTGKPVFCVEAQTMVYPSRLRRARKRMRWLAQWLWRKARSLRRSVHLRLRALR